MLPIFTPVPCLSRGGIWAPRGDRPGLAASLLQDGCVARFVADRQRRNLVQTGVQTWAQTQPWAVAAEPWLPGQSGPAAALSDPASR